VTFNVVGEEKGYSAWFREDREVVHQRNEEEGAKGEPLRHAHFQFSVFR
jgi:hypothetical protein